MRRRSSAWAPCLLRSALSRARRLLGPPFGSDEVGPKFRRPGVAEFHPRTTYPLRIDCRLRPASARWAAFKPPLRRKPLPANSSCAGLVLRSAVPRSRRGLSQSGPKAPHRRSKKACDASVGTGRQQHAEPRSAGEAGGRSLSGGSNADLRCVEPAGKRRRRPGLQAPAVRAEAGGRLLATRVPW